MIEVKSRRAVGVVGTGPTACALACHLVNLGHRVHLLVHDPSRRDWLDRTKGVFLFYYEGVTEQSIAVLEQVELEVRAVAEAYETTLIPMATLLDRYYGCDSGSLLAAMRSVPTYQYAVAPTALSHRFLREDIACSVGLLQELAAVARVATPTIDAVVHLANVLLGEDLRIGGRNLAALGWQGLSRTEILRQIQA